MKVALVIFLVIAALVLATAAAAALALDPLVRRVAQKQAGDALGVPVSLRDADASLGGRLELEGFRAGNPQGFSESRSLRFERIAAQTRLRSLFGRVVDVEDFALERPELTVEFRGRRSNLGVLLDRLGGPERGEDVDAKKFRIRRLRITGATVRFRADVLGGIPRSVALPPIELKDVGTAASAATTGEVLAAILQSLGRAALQDARGLLPGDLIRALGGELEAAAGRIGERLRGLPDVLRKEAEKGVKEEVEKGLDRLRRQHPH